MALLDNTTFIKESTPGFSNKVVRPPKNMISRSGFVDGEFPNRNYMNWLLNEASAWVRRNELTSDVNVIINSVNSDATAASLQAYTVLTNDKIALTQAETITTALSPPSTITLDARDDNGPSGQLIISSSSLTTHMLKVGGNTRVLGNLVLQYNGTGTLTTALEINGDSCYFQNIMILNSSSGTITNGVKINTGVNGTHLQVIVKNTGAGSITNKVLDSSGTGTNTIHERS